MRFLKEVTEAVTAAIGASKVGVRISPENTFNDIQDTNPSATFHAAARMLGPYGLAFLHVVEGDFITGKKRLNYRELKDIFRDLTWPIVDMIFTGPATV